MMYPRLRLARNLLKDDGVIFISIDDVECSNLKGICDEIFGEENFITNIIWQKKFARQNDATYFSTMHDNILCYAKRIKSNKNDSSGFNMNLLPRTDEDNINYKNPDNDERGKWISVDFSAKSGTEKLRYEIVTPAGERYFPAEGRYWSTSKENFEKLVSDNRIWFGNEGKNRPRIKTFLTEVQNGMVPNSIWFYDEVGHTQSSKQDLKKLFDNRAIFDTPKPVELIYRMLYLSTNESDTVLDFFSGSCTTAHATMKLNSEDRGKRKFIMVQLPEKSNEKSEAYRYSYSTICDIGKDRIRRAGEKIKEENKDKEGIEDLDIGFKVFKLDSSNINKWDSSYEQDLESTLLSSVDNIKKDRTEEDILYEILLKYGIDLNMPIEEHDICGKKVFDIGFGAIIACLDDNLTLDIVEEIGKLKEELAPDTCRVVFMDNGFDTDSTKTNAVQILKRYNIEDVKCI